MEARAGKRYVEFKSTNESKKRSRNYQGKERHHGWSSSIVFQAKEQVNTKVYHFSEKENKNYNIYAHEMQMNLRKKHKILSNSLDNS